MSIVSQSNPLAPEDTREMELEQRFRDLGAKALIEEINRLSQVVLGISNRLGDLERSNEVILGLLDFPLPTQGPFQNPLMKRIVVTAKMFCNTADGFYGVEQLPDGTAFRWTGPQREFRFMVYIDRREPCSAELLLIDNQYMNGAAEIACYVDRSLVPTRFWPAGGNKFGRLSFTLPRLEINRGTEILFVTPSVFTPREVISESLDSRSLGVQFIELRIGGPEIDVAQNGSTDVG